MLYAIYAYEARYGGLHGMNSSCIVECDSEKEANEIGFLEALEVMDSYHSIMDEIYDEASNCHQEYSDEWYACVEEIKHENAEYEVYLITDACGMSIAELEDELYNDKEEFIKIHCK